MRWTGFVLAIALVAISGARQAAAQDAASPDSTLGLVDVGYVKTSGNTSVQTITGRERIEHYTGAWTFAQELTAVQGETSDIETAARYTALLRGGYDLSERIGLYLQGQWRREPYAGLSSQFDEGFGATLHAIRPTPHELDLESGLGMLQRTPTSGPDEDFATARFAARYRYHFTDKAIASARGEYLMNLDDTGDGELHAVFGVIAPITSGISMRVSYDVYTRTQPAAGFERTDTTFDTGIQISF
jgi:putative salt-induced outer membrane protein YdiY